MQDAYGFLLEAKANWGHTGIAGGLLLLRYNKKSLEIQGISEARDGIRILSHRKNTDRKGLSSTSNFYVLNWVLI